MRPLIRRICLFVPLGLGAACGGEPPVAPPMLPDPEPNEAQAVLDSTLPAGTRAAVAAFATAFGTMPTTAEAGTLTIPPEAHGTILLAMGRDTVFALATLSRGGRVTVGAASSASTLALMLLGPQIADATQPDGLRADVSSHPAYTTFEQAVQDRMSAGLTPIDATWLRPRALALAQGLRELAHGSGRAVVASLPPVSGQYWIGSSGPIRVGGGSNTDLFVTNASYIYWTATSRDAFEAVELGRAILRPRVNEAASEETLGGVEGVTRFTIDQSGNVSNQNLALGAVAIVNILATVVPFPSATCLDRVTLAFGAVFLSPGFVNACKAGNINAALNDLVFGLTQNVGAIVDILITCMDAEDLFRAGLGRVLRMAFPLIGVLLAGYRDLPTIIDVGVSIGIPNDAQDVCQDGGAIVPCGSVTGTFTQPAVVAALVERVGDTWNVECRAPWTFSLSGGDAALFGLVRLYHNGELVREEQSLLRGGQTGFTINGTLISRRSYADGSVPASVTIGQQLAWDVFTSRELGTFSTPVVTSVCTIGGGQLRSRDAPGTGTAPVTMASLPFHQP